MKKLLKRMTILVVTLAISFSTIFASNTAFAAGSTIDIGYTVHESHIIGSDWVKGSGSMYNAGDYDNVCIEIVGQFFPKYSQYQGLTHPETQTVACKSDLGSHEWSAPDLRIPFDACGEFYTRITAYHNSATGPHELEQKESNHVRVGGDCGPISP